MYCIKIFKSFLKLDNFKYIFLFSYFFIIPTAFIIAFMPILIKKNGA